MDACHALWCMAWTHSLYLEGLARIPQIWGLASWWNTAPGWQVCGQLPPLARMSPLSSACAASSTMARRPAGGRCTSGSWPLRGGDGRMPSRPAPHCGWVQWVGVRQPSASIYNAPSQARHIQSKLVQSIARPTLTLPCKSVICSPGRTSGVVHQMQDRDMSRSNQANGA